MTYRNDDEKLQAIVTQLNVLDESVHKTHDAVVKLHHDITAARTSSKTMDAIQENINHLVEQEDHIIGR